MPATSSRSREFGPDRVLPTPEAATAPAAVAPQPAAGTPRAGAKETNRSHGVPVLVPSIGHLPVPSVHLTRVPIPHLPRPHLLAPSMQGRRGRLWWWGGLAAVAAFGVVDWPVAALVAAGSWVAEQSAKSAKPPEEDRDTDRRRPAEERGKPQR